MQIKHQKKSPATRKKSTREEMDIFFWHNLKNRILHKKIKKQILREEKSPDGVFF